MSLAGHELAPRERDRTHDLALGGDQHPQSGAIVEREGELQRGPLAVCPGLLLFLETTTSAIKSKFNYDCSFTHKRCQLNPHLHEWSQTYSNKIDANQPQ